MSFQLSEFTGLNKYDLNGTYSAIAGWYSLTSFPVIKGVKYPCITEHGKIKEKEKIEKTFL